MWQGRLDAPSSKPKAARVQSAHLENLMVGGKKDIRCWHEEEEHRPQAHARWEGCHFLHRWSCMIDSLHGVLSLPHCPSCIEPLFISDSLELNMVLRLVGGEEKTAALLMLQGKRRKIRIN